MEKWPGIDVGLSNRLNIRLELIERTILDGLRHQLMDPELFKVFAEEFIRESNRLRAMESAAYRRKVVELHVALKDAATRDEAVELIRSLVDTIMLIPESGKLRIELKGALAGILALGPGGTTKPGLLGRALSEQIKLVAGIGFEPMTFRL